MQSTKHLKLILFAFDLELDFKTKLQKQTRFIQKIENTS